MESNIRKGEKKMSKKYYGEIVLQGMCWDVERMLREKQSPKLILNLIKKKISFLEKPKWHKVIWWEKNQQLKTTDLTELLPENNNELIVNGVLEE
jgi:hypothetical protein